MTSTAAASGAALYTIDIEPDRKLMAVRVYGFWTPAVMSAYLAEMRQQGAILAAAGGCRRILIDMSDYPIQAAEIAEGHAAALRLAKEKIGARAAILMRSALSRLQVSRLASATGHRIFDDEAAAIAWLMDDPDPS